MHTVVTGFDPMRRPAQCFPRGPGLAPAGQAHRTNQDDTVG